MFKNDLIQYYKEKFGSEPTENDLGKLFESLIPKRSSDAGYPLKKNTTTFDDANDRNTKPDYIGDAKLEGWNLPTVRIKDAVWVEMKQKGGGVYLSTDDGQIEGHINNIAAKFSGLRIKYLRYNFRPKFRLITTADVKPSKGILERVMWNNISFEHIHAEFKRIVKGNIIIWSFRFTDIVQGF